MLKISELKTEYRQNPIGLDVAKPRFSWILKSDRNDTVQCSYSIIVKGADGIVWDSGKVENSQSVLSVYSGLMLKPRTRYNVTVAVHDNHGESAAAEGWFETGLMSCDNRKASWITHGYEDKVEACPVYVREFDLSGKVKAARVYASALGVYELEMNGRKAGDAFLAPGWTSYHTRVQYQTYDITDMMEETNKVVITSANGWFAGEFGFAGGVSHYGSRTAVWAQIEIDYEDGHTDTIVTDSGWQYGSGPRRYAEIYHGEVIDHNIPVKIEGNAIAFDYPISVLTAQESESVRITERLKPAARMITPKGEVVYDFGQNLTGIIEARLNCPKGTKVVLGHAEVLDKEGNFYTENLRSARAEDTFICAGEGEETFLPAFTFHGFRYIRVEGLSDKREEDCFTACVLHTDMEAAGHFQCSNEAVNRLQQNIRWGQRGNFLDIPTDCPQRDERLGWTGDAQVFASTAAYNYNTALFFTKWLRDLKAEQTLEHGVPHVIPNILSNIEGAAAWSDAAAIIPWEMYQAYGDIRLLADQYDSMRDWVEYIRSKAGESHLWQTGHQYADWLALDNEPASRVGATDPYLVATAYYAYSTDLTARAAKVLGKTEDAALYAKLHDDIVSAFRKEYITETGRMVSETQTGCVLTLHFDLAKPEHRERIFQSLTVNLANHNNHLTTGFVGTPYLCHVLSNNGSHETAGTVFLKHDYPSWLYCVDMGATTIWERWDSMKKDGSFDESGMNSFNHYAYGSVGSWMYQKLGGLQIEEPGYKKSRIAPVPIKGITCAEASVRTVYGELSCKWECTDHKMTVDIAVPCNTTATVCLPGKEEFLVASGSYHYEYQTELELEYERYSMESTLGEILDNPVAMEILSQHAPGIADNPMIQFALEQSISQLTALMPEGSVQLFAMVIKACNDAEKTN